MGSEWEKVVLGEHCSKIGSGATPRGGSNVYLDSGEISLIRSQNIYNDGFKEDGLVYITQESADKLKNVILEENDILLNITGDSVARVCLVKNKLLPARVNQHVAIIRPIKSSFHYSFLRYQLSSPIMQNWLLNLASAGATRNALTKTMIETLKVSKPPLPEQKAIANILGTLDGKIELNRQMNETLETIAQALFKSWFVDFDPVLDNAITAGNPIPDALAERAEQRKQLLAEQTQVNPYAEHFPSEFEFTEELGWIPKGWKSGTLSDVCNVIGGYAFKSKQFSSSGIPIIKIKNINSDKTVDVIDVQYIPTSLAKKTEKFILKTGDIVMAMTGATVGKFGLLVTNSDSPFLLNQRVAKFEPSVKENEIWFIYSILNRKEIINHIINIAEGSAQPNISSSAIMSTDFSIPQAETIKLFNKKTDGFFKKVIKNIENNFKLSKLRDTLLPQLLSGKLRIADAEKMVAELNL